MIYLYGLAHPETATEDVDLSELPGVTGPVALSPTRFGTLIHGPAPEGEILPKRRLLLAHTKVLEAFNAQGTVLPMRFGMSAPDPAALEAMLAQNPEAVAASFTRLDGAIELGLRVRFDRARALDAVLAQDRTLRSERDRLARRRPPPHFETAEFGRRLAEALDRRRGAAQKALLEALSPHLSDHVLRAPDEDTQVLAADVLIKRSDEAAFASAVEAAAAGLDFAPGADAEIRLIGPVPAYSFVRLTLSAEAGAAAA